MLLDVMLSNIGTSLSTPEWGSLAAFVPASWIAPADIAWTLWDDEVKQMTDGSSVPAGFHRGTRKTVIGMHFGAHV